MSKDAKKIVEAEQAIKNNPTTEFDVTEQVTTDKASLYPNKELILKEIKAQEGSSSPDEPPAYYQENIKKMNVACEKHELRTKLAERNPTHQETQEKVSTEKTQSNNMTLVMLKRAQNQI